MIDRVNVYKKFLHIIRQHGEALLLYEILMRSIGFLIGALLVLLFDLSFRHAEGGLLINSDFLGFFEGYRLIFLTLAIFAILYVSLVEIVGLCYISVHEERGAHILAALRYSVRRSASILHAYGLHAVLAIFLCVFFFPIFDVGPAYLRGISVPTFVTDEISRYAFLPYAYGAAAIVIAILLFRSAFSFHIFALNKKDMMSSIRGSWRITRRKTHVAELIKWGVVAPAIISLAMIALTGILSYVVLAILNALTIALISVFPQGVSLVFYASWVYLLSTAISLMIGPILISLISAYLLVRAPEALDFEIIRNAKSFSSKTEQDLREGLNVASNGYLDSRAALRVLRRPFFVIAFGAVSFLVFSYVSSRFLHIYDDKPARPALISHRGTEGTVIDSHGEQRMARENSIEAFSLFLRSETARGMAKGIAAPLGIETDLQSLGDGSVIVFHDADLRRGYGVDRKVIDLSAKDLDAMFATTSATKASSSAAGPIAGPADRPASVADLLGFVKRSGICPTLLEIKAYEDLASAEHAASSTIAEIRKGGLEKCAYLGSLDRRVVEYAERIAPDILTNQYVYTKAGDIAKAGIADAFSLEYSIANERLIRDLKRSGKKVFVWTLNDRRIAEDMYAAGVDGIITDNPDAVRSAFESYEEFMEHVDPKVVTLFGKTFLIDLKDAWQPRLSFPVL